MGLRMLAMWDNQARVRKEERELKLALLASGKVAPSDVFPELFESEADDGAADYDYSEVQWEAPSSDGTNYDTVMAALEAHRRVTTRDGSGTSEGVKPPTFPLEPEDPEWI